MKEKIKAFMMYLGENQWDDSPIRKNSRGSGYLSRLTTEKHTWREISEKAVEYGFNTVFIPTVDGLKYKSHPEIAVPGAWEVEELKEELKWMRSIGLTPIPELNFSTAHDIWLGEYSRMVSTPIYYEVVRDLIHEVIDIFDKPELFLMDQDEEGELIQRRMDFVCYRQYDLLWHDIKFIQDCIREKGVRPWMYVDLYANHPEEFLQHIKKDVVISPWYYEHFYEDVETKLPQPDDDPENYDNFLWAKIKSYTELPALGYDIIPVASNCYRDFSIDHTIRYMKEKIPQDKLIGYGLAPWNGTTTQRNKYGFFCQFEATKNAFDKYYEGGKF